ncbi:MAG: type II CAAX endopeptidase family protein [Tannerella sp.]|nr:type II CAAX endopeptidase family protein [Tannerella sp.]
MKGMFADRGDGFQAVVLLITMVSGYLLASSFHAAILLITGEENKMHLPPGMLLGIQFVASVSVFLTPAVLTAFLCSDEPRRFLHIQSLPNIRIWFLVGGMTLLLIPFVSLISMLNAQMELPDALTPIERRMRETQQAADALVRQMLSGSGTLLPFSLLVMAVGASITEEFFFRGTLFSLLRKKIRNPHAVIWIVAALFSTLHFQFYGFLPRMLLGAFLGYLVYWCRSIWMPIFAHCINNACAIISISSGARSEHALTTDASPEKLRMLTIGSIVGLTLFALLTVRMKRLLRKQKEA